VTWLNAVVQGLLLGGAYALFACGLSLMFGVMRIINLAHGDIGVLGAFFALSVSGNLGISPFLSLAIVLPAMGAAGYVLQRVALERSLRAGVLVPLLTTFGLAIVIQNLLLEGYTADAHSLDVGSFAYSSWTITSQLSIPKLGVLTFAVAVALLGGLQLFLSFSPQGRAMRATAEDPDTAQLVGINARRVYGVATAVAVATAALAGAFFGMRSTFDPSSGPTQLIYAFETVVIGGLGSLWGTLGGGVVLGLAQTIGTQLAVSWPYSTGWGGPFAGHVVFLAALLVRLGLFAVGSRRGGLLAALGAKPRPAEAT
jgi:branched-chain amino acid transport system permease protein